VQKKRRRPKREERELEKRKREEDKLMLVEANKAKKEAKLKARRCGECAKVFRHQKTWWLCPQCKLYRLCTDHSTDGVSIPEHEGEGAQAIENTPPIQVFSAPYRGSALNFSTLSLNMYFIVYVIIIYDRCRKRI
jgi:hypothetical protein